MEAEYAEIPVTEIYCVSFFIIMGISARFLERRKINDEVQKGW